MRWLLIFLVIHTENKPKLDIHMLKKENKQGGQ